MQKPVRMSWQTRKNWLIDTAVFAGALLSVLTGIYFLFLPIGGYQGGRNALYGVTILFTRATWDDLHVWGGVLMIAAVVVHFAIHWEWVKMMARRVVRLMRGEQLSFSRGARVNVALDLAVALGFLGTAVSGIYFLFVPGGYQGGRVAGWDPGLLFSRLTWDTIHTWSAIVMTVAAVAHFAIHWRWVVNVTRRFFQSLWQTGNRPSSAVQSQ